jgi:hypothetical protein
LKRILTFAGILLGFIAIGIGICRLYADAGFTPWMSHGELDTFLAQFDTNPPGGHPNYWDRGHWINAVEGRWHDGIPQYRIRYGPVPSHKGLWWYWYLNQDQESFSSHVHEMADQGFTLLDPNSFSRPDDTRRYQGVWHKVIPPDPITSH